MTYNQEISSYLKHEFLQRKSKNSSYSLRAFSRDLKVDQSWLSRFLKGEKGVTPKLAEKCLKNIQTPPDIMKKLLREMESAYGEYTDIEESKVDFLSDWKYWVLLEHFKIEAALKKEKLSEMLNITTEVLDNMLRTLQKLDLIRINQGKIELLSPNNNWTSTEKTSEARRKLQKDLLNLSIHALDHVPLDERLHTSLTVAINKKNLPKFRKRLSTLLLEFGGQAQKYSDLQEVYQLTLSFFPIIHKGGLK